MFNKEKGHMAEKGTTRRIKNDILFICGLLLVIAIVSISILAFGKTGFITGESGNTVKVEVDGKLYGTYSLNENQTVEIVTERGRNILVIENGEAYVKEASCPDGVCSSHRPIKYIGASILCLPNKVVISIESSTSVPNDDNGGGSNDGGLDIIV